MYLTGLLKKHCPIFIVASNKHQIKKGHNLESPRRVEVKWYININMKLLGVLLL